MYLGTYEMVVERVISSMVAIITFNATRKIVLTVCGTSRYSDATPSTAKFQHASVKETASKGSWNSWTGRESIIAPPTK